MKSKRTMFSSVAVFAASLVLGALALSAQSTQAIDSTDPRPLAVAVNQLEIATHIPINYEDPPYENAADVQDVATVAQKAARPGFQNLVPRGGHIAAQVSLSMAGKGTEGDVVLGASQLLANYRQNALPGDFKVEQANGMVYITPTKVLGANGSMRDVTSPLTATVTLPNAKRTIAETAQAILDAASKASRVTIVIGSFPFFQTDVVTFGATAEPARDALARLFAQTGKGQFSYRLLFDPKPDTMRTFDYMLNVQPAAYVAPMAPADLGPINVSSGSTTPQPTGGNPAFIKVQ
jgi:hypothetical protein